MSNKNNKNNSININKKNISYKRSLNLNQSDDDSDNNVEEIDIKNNKKNNFDDYSEEDLDLIDDNNKKSFKNEEKKISKKDISNTIKTISDLTIKAEDVIDKLNNTSFIFDENNKEVKEKIIEDCKKNINLENKIYSILKDENTINNLINKVNFNDEENKINNILEIIKYVYIRIPYVFPSNKVCEKCNLLLPISNFKLFNTTKDGLKKICIKCDSSKKNIKKKLKTFIKDDENIYSPPNLNLDNKKHISRGANNSLNAIMYNNQLDSRKNKSDNESDIDLDNSLTNNKLINIKKKNENTLTLNELEDKMFKKKSIKLKPSSFNIEKHEDSE